MIKGRIYSFGKVLKPTEPINFNSFQEGLDFAHEDAAVFWDRDMADFELPDTVRLELITDEVFPELWGVVNVCWGHLGVYPNHIRFVRDPSAGWRWILVGSEAWTAYAACVQLMRPITSFTGI